MRVDSRLLREEKLRCFVPFNVSGHRHIRLTERLHPEGLPRFAKIRPKATAAFLSIPAAFQRKVPVRGSWNRRFNRQWPSTPLFRCYSGIFLRYKY